MKYAATFKKNSFDKIAVNLEELRTASKLLKPKLLRAIPLNTGLIAARKKSGLFGMNMGYEKFVNQYQIATKKRPEGKFKRIVHILKNPPVNPDWYKNLKVIERMKNKGFKKGVIFSGSRGTEKALTDILSESSKNTKGLQELPGLPGKIFKILTGGKKRVNSIDQLKQSIKNLDPKNKETLNRIGLLHEGFETKVKNIHTLGSHLSPTVLYREHNLIRTLPPELKPAGDIYRQWRSIIGETGRLKKLNPKFNYGESNRLSRHKIKQMEQQNIKKTPMSQRVFGKTIGESAGKIDPKMYTMLK
jgi:hypothetical protein